MGCSNFGKRLDHSRSHWEKLEVEIGFSASFDDFPFFEGGTENSSVAGSIPALTTPSKPTLESISGRVFISV